MRGVLLILALLLVLPICSASLYEDMNEVSVYINEYKSGRINAPQLIVYLEYLKNKMYETLDKEGRKAFTEDEIKTVFVKRDTTNNQEWYDVQYEKKFTTQDFHIIFTANSFYRHDKSYYEQREDDTTNYYTIDFDLVSSKSGDEENLEEEVKDFISDFKTFVENPGDFDELRERFSKIKSKTWDLSDCKEFMQSIGMSEYEKDYETERTNYYYPIKEVTDKNCWDDSYCEQVCDDYEDCYTPDCTPDCIDEETCEETCEDFFNEETNQTEQNCTNECSMEEICSGCENIEEICETRSDCHEECYGDEKCDEFINGEIKFEGECREDSSNFWINAWGEGFDYYNELNEGEDWNCEPEVQGLVSVRKAIQKDMNNEFAVWFFEDFMGGDDYDKIINGEHGFRGVLDILIRNEEEIANNLHCSESKEWPAGFEKIDITYTNNNTHVEVWEKMIPAEWMQDTKFYTTLYKYSWIPDRELLKGLINYKLSEIDTFGPSAKDIAQIKADEGQMEVINSLSDRYGGSFDIKLELIEQEGENFAVKRYLQINPDVIIKFSDELTEKPDISVEVDYDTLYNFISYMSYEMEGDKIEGPHWVWIDDKEGPGKFFSVVGAVSKMWREGVTIKPRYALLKLFFNSKNIISLISGVDSGDDYEGEKVKMSGEVIEER